MSNYADLFTSFYNQFVLRDLLSMIFPGLLVIVIFSVFFNGSRIVFRLFELFRNPWISLIFLLGFSYLIGIFFIVFSDKTTIFKTYYTEDPEEFQKITKIFIEKCPSGLFYGKDGINFLQIRERYIIFMQTCGNFGWACIICCLASAFLISFSLLQVILTLIFGILALFSKMGYNQFSSRLEEWDKIIVGVSRTSEREITAYHEAAHCVMAESLGYNVKKAWVVWYRDDNGEFNYELLSMLRLLISTLKGSQDNSIITKSGNFIQTKRFPQSKIFPSDGRAILTLSTFVQYDENSIGVELQKFFSDDHNNNSLQEIAKVLIDEGEIYGEEIREIIHRVNKENSVIRISD